MNVKYKNAPPTEAQVNYALNLGIIPGGMTRGELSELLNRHGGGKYERMSTERWAKRLEALAEYEKKGLVVGATVIVRRGSGYASAVILKIDKSTPTVTYETLDGKRRETDTLSDFLLSGDPRLAVAVDAAKRKDDAYRQKIKEKIEQQDVLRKIEVMKNEGIDVGGTVVTSKGCGKVVRFNMEKGTIVVKITRPYGQDVSRIWSFAPDEVFCLSSPSLVEE